MEGGVKGVGTAGRMVKGGEGCGCAVRRVAGRERSTRMRPLTAACHSPEVASCGWILRRRKRKPAGSGVGGCHFQRCCCLALPVPAVRISWQRRTSAVSTLHWGFIIATRGRRGRCAAPSSGVCARLLQELIVRPHSMMNSCAQVRRQNFR